MAVSGQFVPQSKFCHYQHYVPDLQPSQSLNPYEALYATAVHTVITSVELHL